VRDLFSSLKKKTKAAIDVGSRQGCTWAMSSSSSASRKQAQGSRFRPYHVKKSHSVNQSISQSKQFNGIMARATRHLSFVSKSPSSSLNTKTNISLILHLGIRHSLPHKQEEEQKKRVEPNQIIHTKRKNRKQKSSSLFKAVSLNHKKASKSLGGKKFNFAGAIFPVPDRRNHDSSKRLRLQRAR